MIHFSLDSNLIYKDSDEAQRQINRQKGELSADEGSEEENDEEEEDGEDGEKEEDKPEGELEEKEGREGGEEQEQLKVKDQGKKKKKGSVSTGGEKQLRNQFNFSERASQTLNNPCRVRRHHKGRGLMRRRATIRGGA